ncbi:hypothetical protein ABZT03_36770 [Streptomyces sp. NPDC005574]|uniref:hypothetical protein n=1 Tax=Streptomyces sp. NPDC005574 TaxID=3156891 RepID=UPI0033A8DD2A
MDGDRPERAAGRASRRHGAGDPSAIPLAKGYDTAGTAFPRRIPALLNLVAPERVLFGSDYCWTPSGPAGVHLAALDAAESPVEGATWRSLTTVKAQRLFSARSR